MTISHRLIACLALVVVAGIFFACGEADWMGMKCPEETGKITMAAVTYQWTADPKVSCETLGVETLDRGGACISCSQVGAFMSCTLYAERPSVIADRVLGHEMKHAFGCKHA